MRLADFILQNMVSILQAWEDYARTIYTPLANLDEVGLRNHAESILRTVALDIASPQFAIEQYDKSRGLKEPSSVETAAQVRAVCRLEAGFTLDQVVAA